MNDVGKIYKFQTTTKYKGLLLTLINFDHNMDK